MKYLLAGGGTGGHIFPAIAIADEIKKKDPDAEILFIGAKGRIEEKIVPSNNYELITLDLSGFDRSDFRKNLKLPVKLIFALRKCSRIIREFEPDVVIGTGGFVSAPVIYTANKLKIPTLIQEGNSFAGKTTKFLSRKSGKVVINFEETAKYLKRKDNIIRISHPVRSSLKLSVRNTAIESFGLSADRRTIFVFGGSQGAKGINLLMESILKKLYEKDINVIWQTGAGDFERIKAGYTDMIDKLRVLEFIDNIDSAYSASDIVICRAGITSIMEIAYLKKASILIPLPSSAENHQEMNARSLAERNSAVLVLQKEGADKLYSEIMDLISNEDRVNELRKNVDQISDPQASAKIADEAIKLIRRR